MKTDIPLEIAPGENADLECELKFGPGAFRGEIHIYLDELNALHELKVQVHGVGQAE